MSSLGITFAIEAEIAISSFDITEKDYYRHTVAINIENISQKDNITSKGTKKNGNY
jgi:hypothetical protein